MITEDYVSYEVSKLLKEKGFDWMCDYFYDDPRRQELRTKNGEDKYWNGHLWDDEYAAPTHQMTMKWLREVHKIYADPIQQGNYDDNSIYYSYIVAQIIDGRSYIQRPMSGVDKFTYEEAVEAALLFVLKNLI